ncbi:jg20714 [Pararge aegeria aegeria]|uniref:Jg20714 protein n=1 Tax=Pararge aegeria aegeria TaxID=348720 RepID=A0A8S4QLL2_9NEOP|nr:jg20714 [Pararge aegeria aegeria]
MTFTLKTGECPAVKLGQETLKEAKCVKCLGFYLDRRLTWKDHIKKKRDELGNRFRNLLWLLGRQSTLSLDNKLLVYCSILKPIWLYGIQVWSTTCKSNIRSIQRAQNRILRTIANAPWFTRNTEIYHYLGVPTVIDEINSYSPKYRERLVKHPNPLAHSLLTVERTRRLKRAEVLDTVQT